MRAGDAGDYDLGSPLVQFGDDCVRIKGLASQQTAELDTFDKWRDPYSRIRTRAIFHVVIAAFIDGRHQPLYLSKYLNIV